MAAQLRDRPVRARRGTGGRLAGDRAIVATAFSIIDEAKGDARARSVLRRVEGGVYNRLAYNEEDGLPPVLPTGPAKALDPLRPQPLPEPRLKP